MLLLNPLGLGGKRLVSWLTRSAASSSRLIMISLPSTCCLRSAVLDRISCSCGRCRAMSVHMLPTGRRGLDVEVDDAMVTF
jgi:hypothetical protein